jgi:uncharacterized protein (DUF58 family)
MSLIGKLQLKLFRWQKDLVVPIRLGQRRVFILPTGAGLLFATMLFVMLLGAINYNLALGHALVFLLAGLGMAGMVHTFRNLHGLIITPSHCEPVFAGETAYFSLQLENNRTSPRLSLEFSSGAEHLSECHLAAFGNIRIALPLLSQQRGWLELPRIRLATVYPLGLFVAWSYLQPEMRCLIYPQALTTPLPLDSPNGESGQKRGDSGEEDFAGFRERQAADSPRHIAWKAHARAADNQPLLLKQFAGGEETQLRLAWSMTAAQQDNEARIAQMTGWVVAAEAEKLCYSLHLPGHDIASGHGHHHQRECLQALALFQP